MNRSQYRFLIMLKSEQVAFTICYIILLFIAALIDKGFIHDIMKWLTVVAAAVTAINCFFFWDRFKNWERVLIIFGILSALLYFNFF